MKSTKFVAIIGFVETPMQSFDQITRVFRPPTLVSWQTIFLIGLVSLLLAIVVSNQPTVMTRLAVDSLMPN
ncbi:MAG: hypothetical protein F6K04_27135 [Leptolyngbya sp. SIO4C5]|nr:hypothetical protein [Leptolyngbya sp. SIO4C5]